MFSASEDTKKVFAWYQHKVVLLGNSDSEKIKQGYAITFVRLIT
jgi:hypothetical protein